MWARDGRADRPPAVVLSFTGTGLATVRCLSEGGMDIHAAVFPQGGEGLEVEHSRYCTPIELDFGPEDEEATCGFLIELAGALGRRPVVFPTNDATALLLARHRSRLESACTTWETTHDELSRIVHKDRLYEAAAAAGVRVPPMLVAPEPGEVAAWCRDNRPPYLVKPFYSSIPGCRMKRKNRVFRSAAELVGYARSAGLESLVVQRMIESGDGHVYDAYGLCDRRREPVVLASHRRIRQFPPDTGATSFGEIPVIGAPELVGRLFDGTRRLLSTLRYHGIFGVEWLHERGTGDLYMVDFNARPFSSIGHLAASGLNLPLLAYRELIGEEGLSVERYPGLVHRYWMDFNWDLRGFRSARRARGQTWRGFAADVLSCTSFAYFDVRDPVPWLRRGVDLLRILADYTKKS